jgi:hypothetical protein
MKGLTLLRLAPVRHSIKRGSRDSTVLRNVRLQTAAPGESYPELSGNKSLSTSGILPFTPIQNTRLRLRATRASAVTPRHTPLKYPSNPSFGQERADVAGQACSPLRRCAFWRCAWVVVLCSRLRRMMMPRMPTSLRRISPRLGGGDQDKTPVGSRDYVGASAIPRSKTAAWDRAGRSFQDRSR